MPKLTNAELLLLDNLIYTKYVKNGRTVKEIVDLAQQDIENGTFKPSCQMSTKEWSTVLNHIENNKNLSSYQVSNYVNEDTGMRAACFVDDVTNPSDVNVVFRGTSGDYEWHDNGQGAYVEDTNQQIAAADYVNNLPGEYGNNIVVTGHSKGGNKAQYVTITTDRIEKCVSYDGQGFGQDFIDKYSDEIAEKNSKIISISAENDYVNCLLQPIAGEKIYIETEKQDFIDYHKPNILLGDDGELRPGNSKPSEVSRLINEYTTYIDQNLQEPEKSYTVDGLIALLEKGENKESTAHTVISVVNSVGHVDDFMISRIKNKYGDAAAYAGVYIAALAMPFVFIDDFFAATREAAVDLYEGTTTFAKHVCNKIGEGVKTAGKWIENAYNDAKSFVKGSLTNMVEGGINVMWNDELKFDVDKLRETKAKCDEIKLSLTEKKTNLINQLEDLRKDWQTDAGKAFFEDQNTDWTAQVDNYVRITEAISKLLDVAITQYENVVSEAKRLNI